MTTSQEKIQLARTRKPKHTYSFSMHGDTFHLALSTPTSSGNTMGNIVIPQPNSLPQKILENSSPDTPSSSRLYIPCPPIPRDIRRNLYLYRQTAVDIAKERKRNELRAAAAEEARKEREDDERRRNLMLGVTVPRKSSRTRIKAKPGVDSKVVLAVVEQACHLNGRKAPKSRTTAKYTPPDVPPSTASRQTSDFDSACITPPRPAVTADPSLSSKKSRQRPRPKMSAKSTERLTTRSLAKAKANSMTGDSDAEGFVTSPLELEDCGELYVDIESPDRSAGRSSPSAHPRGNIQEAMHKSAVKSKITTFTTLLDSATVPKAELGTNTPPLLLCTNNELSKDKIPEPIDTSQGIQESAKVDDLPTSSRLLVSSGASGTSLGRRPSPLSQAHTLDFGVEDTDFSSSSSGGAQSSDTLCDVVGDTMHDAKGLAALDLITTEQEHSIFVTGLPPSSFVRRNSPPHTPVNPNPASPPVPITSGDKRKLDAVEAGSKASPQVEARRSGRVIKKRKLYY